MVDLASGKQIVATLSRQSARPARRIGESGPGAEGQHEWGGKGGQQETQPLDDGKSGTRLVSIAQGELRIGRPGSWLLKNRGRLLILHHPIGSFLRTVSNERDDLLQVVVQIGRAHV